MTPEPGAGLSHQAAAEAFLGALGGLDHLLAGADELVDDLLALRMAYPEPAAYAQALDAVLQRLREIAPRTPGRPLVGPLAGWRKVRFTAGEDDIPGDLRLAFRPRGEAVELLGFGHRFEPRDFYERLKRRRRP